MYVFVPCLSPFTYIACKTKKTEQAHTRTHTIRYSIWIKFQLVATNFSLVRRMPIRENELPNLHTNEKNTRNVPLRTLFIMCFICVAILFHSRLDKIERWWCTRGTHKHTHTHTIANISLITNSFVRRICGCSFTANSKHKYMHILLCIKWIFFSGCGIKYDVIVCSFWFFLCLVESSLQTFRFVSLSLTSFRFKCVCKHYFNLLWISIVETRKQFNELQLKFGLNESRSNSDA